MGNIEGATTLGIKVVWAGRQVGRNKMEEAISTVTRDYNEIAGTL